MIWVTVLAIPFMGWVTWGNLRNFSEPQFFYLPIGHNHASGILWGLKEMIHQIKHLMWSLFTEVLFLQHFKAEQRELSGRVTCCLTHGVHRNGELWGGVGETPEACSIAAYLYPIRWCGWWGLLSELYNPGRLDFCKADKCGWGGIVTWGISAIVSSPSQVADPARPGLHLTGVMRCLELSPFSVNITLWTFPHTVKHPRFPFCFPSLTRGPHYFKEWNYSVKIYLENFATLRCWKTWIGNPNYFNSKVIKF